MKASPPRDAFLSHGFASRETYDHFVAVIPKAYPDTHLQLTRRGYESDVINAAVAWQVNVYATDLTGIDEQVLTDPELNWHRQQLGRPGLVAAAGLVEVADHLEVTLLQSDLVQQAFRHPSIVRPAVRNALDNRFGRWWRPLVNACLDTAFDLGYERLLIPTARQIVSTTTKPIDGALFERIYDAVERHYVCSRRVVGAAEYWDVPLADNEASIVRLSAALDASDEPSRPPSLLLFHDIEGDIDTDVDPADCRAAVARMLEIEREAGVRVTYNVLGLLLESHRDEIAADGHEIAFHTYDHALGDTDQLRRCRSLDGRIRGYRPARSWFTAEHEPSALRRWDFEWLISSAAHLGYRDPCLRQGVAYLPVDMDDYALWMGEGLESWIGRLERLLSEHTYVAVGLHDCYAARWLDVYPDLLANLAQRARIVTAEDVTAELYLAAAASSANGVRSEIRAK